MTYEEMKRRVQRLEVLRAQMETLNSIQGCPVDLIELRNTNGGYFYINREWISENNGFERVSAAIKKVAAEISEEIKAEIAKLEED